MPKRVVRISHVRLQEDELVRDVAEARKRARVGDEVDAEIHDQESREARKGIYVEMILLCATCAAAVAAVLGIVRWLS